MYLFPISVRDVSINICGSIVELCFGWKWGASSYHQETNDLYPQYCYSGDTYMMLKTLRIHSASNLCGELLFSDRSVAILQGYILSNTCRLSIRWPELRHRILGISILVRGHIWRGKRLLRQLSADAWCKSNMMNRKSIGCILYGVAEYVRIVR